MPSEYERVCVVPGGMYVGTGYAVEVSIHHVADDGVNVTVSVAVAVNVNGAPTVAVP